MNLSEQNNLLYDEYLSQDFSKYHDDTPYFVETLHVTKLPGRNEPCPCGSGKKFKKCCINKIIKEYR